MWSSLWIDEIGTWWATKERFGDILGRSRLLIQPLLHVAIVWGTRQLLGGGEASLRLPSLLAALLAVWAIYRLGRELFDRETAVLAAGLFLAFPPIVHAAHDARAYALGVLAVIVAAWMLARWSRTGRPAYAAGYAAAAGATIYLHYLLAAVIPAHVAWLWLVARRRASHARLSQVLAVLAAIAILAAPALVLVLEIKRTGPLHAFVGAPGPRDVIEALLPQRVLGPLLLGVVAVFVAARRRFRLRLRPDSGSPIALLLLWILVPVGLLAAAAVATGLGVFHQRFLMSIVPAQALLLARLVRGIEPAGGRRVVLALYLAIILAARGIVPAPVREDWAGAAAALRAANRGRPVLLGGTFVESRSVALVRDPVHEDYLRAPLDYYDAGGKTIVLPLRAESAREAEAYADEVLRSARIEGGFALIERTSQFPSWSDWLAQRAREKGLAMRRVWDGERLKAWVFDRSP